MKSENSILNLGTCGHCYGSFIHFLKNNTNWMRKKLFIVLIFIILPFASRAQIITCDPPFPTDKDSVIITFNAALGNAGLKGFTGDVYAHTGVITNHSATSSDWKYAPVWGDNSAKYKLSRIGTDIYQLVISPSIRKYYGVAQNDTILKLAFVFRSADKSKEGKTESNGDIFYDLINDTLIHVQLLSPAAMLNIAQIGDKVPIKAIFSKADSMQLIINGQLIKSIINNTLYNDTLEITQQGYTNVYLKIFKGIESVVDSFSYYVISPTVSQPLPAGCHDGINYINDTTVTLCIVAPNKKASFVIGEFNNWKLDTAFQMKQTPDKSRFWVTISHLTAGKEYAYQFFVDNLTIADPFCNKILDPWNDKYISSSTYPDLKPYPEGKTTGIVSVLQPGKAQYQWKYSSFSAPDRANLNIYELLVRDFQTSHTYQAIIDSLGYFKRLGINAIELMPVMEFEGNESWGYNPAFYFAPDKYYGNENLLKKLIDTCHSQGIAIILDIVLNHSFGQCPLVQLYWDSVNNRPSASSPWYNPTPTHDYNVGYDFNHESPYTRLFVSQVLKFWLSEYKIDGYRFDLSKGFTQTYTLGNVNKWGLYDASRIRILKTYADTIWKVNPKAYMILEHFAENKEEQELVGYGMMVWGNENGPYREASMGWNESSKSDFSWGSYKNRSFANPGLVTYMESHDEERVVYSNLTWGNDNNGLYTPKNNLEISLQRAELCALFLLGIPGPKMIWQFGELGYDYSIDYNGRVGDKPIRWDYYQNPNRLRLYSFYCLMNQLRNQLPIFQTNDFSLNVGGTIKTITLNYATYKAFIAGNFDVFDQNATLNFPTTGWWYEYFSGDSINISQTNTNINLRPGEYRMYFNVRLPKPGIISAPQALNVSISGNLSVGSTLRANYTYFDANNDPEGDTQFKWYKSTSSVGKGKIQISQTSDSEYTLTADDKGNFIFVEVIPYAQTGMLLKGLSAWSYVDYGTGVLSEELSPLKVYPNPFIDNINISIEHSLISQRISINLYDVSGKTVYSTNNSAEQTINLNLRDLPRGFYILSLNSSSFNKPYYYKIVKK
jgi:1,4-alpha-glucan branching enzyme